MSALPPKADIKSRNRALRTGPLGPRADWAEHVCSAPQLNVNLLRNCQSTIHVDAEVSNSAFDFPVTKQELDGA